MKLHNLGEPVMPTRFNNVSGILFVFVVLSFLVHGGAFLFSLDSVAQLPESRFGTSVISTLLAPTNNKPATASALKQTTPADKKRQAVKTPALKQEKTPSTMVSTKASTITTTNIDATTLQTKTKPATKKLHNKPLSTETTKTKTTNTATPSPTQSLANQQARQRNYLLGEMQNRLSQYLIYPQRARRRGWQGQVMVAIHITHRGQLDNVRLAKSSGYPLLDDSAMIAITKLGQISLPESLGPLQAIDLILPVSYQLRES